jgi:arginyl-tRNA synthetase
MIKDQIIKIITSYCDGAFNQDSVTLVPPPNNAHGDLACNALLIAAKVLGAKRSEAIEALRTQLIQNEDIIKIDIVGPGFINIFFRPSYWQKQLTTILNCGDQFGHAQQGGLVRETINIEFVSTNPTGPLHVGHGRSAVLGDALARLLEATGHNVTKEYYINDAGNQVNHLARSVYLRYLEALGEKISPDQFTADMYGGDYLIPLGQHIANIDGDKWRISRCHNDEAQDPDNTDLLNPDLHQDDNGDEMLIYFKKLAVDFLMDAIKTDLKLLNIGFDVFTSEQQLIEENRVQQAIDHLSDLGHLYTGVLEKPEGHDDDTYEARQQLLFKATNFGDDKDRALMKSDNTWTYFASDIAYHYDKYKRGFDTCINVWGADHIGYVKRLKAATKAVANKNLEIIIAQMVNFMEDGKPYRMSKRAGTFVTLREVVEDIGPDAFRFMLLSRQQDSKYDFDFHVVREHSKDNLVFYVQYAYARVCSVKRRFEEVFPGRNYAPEYLEYLTWDTEFSIIKLMDDFPRHVLLATQHREPHRLVNYLYDLACTFHTLWSEGRAKEYRFIEPDQFELTSARLCLLDAIGITIKNGMTMLGVSVKEQM